jgi:2,3,4,5-tetrahydropyridine-2-carboxylate N-succinyltransferase
MAAHSLQKPIEDLWEQRDGLTSATRGEARDAVEAALEALDNGTVRVAEKTARLARQSVAEKGGADVVPPD